MYDYGECHTCGNRMEGRRVKQDFWVKGKLIVVEDVPAGVCPQCGEKKRIRPYDPPQVAERRQLLLDQLAAARAARRAARRSGQPLPVGVRSPNDIMRDLDALPQLFLVTP